MGIRKIILESDCILMTRHASLEIFLFQKLAPWCLRCRSYKTPLKNVRSNMFIENTISWLIFLRSMLGVLRLLLCGNLFMILLVHQFEMICIVMTLYVNKVFNFISFPRKHFLVKKIQINKKFFHFLENISFLIIQKTQEEYEHSTYLNSMSLSFNTVYSSAC